MSVTETTTEGWGSRLGSSLKGVLVGLALFVAGFPVLFWNEGNSVATAKALDEGEGACIAVESNAKVDSGLEGRLVHMTGLADTQAVLADDVFGVSERAIRLERQVEMYQWREHSRTEEKKNLGGSVTKTTTYTYDQGWEPRAISSANFKEAGHVNPPAIEFPSRTQYASAVSFGAFRLNEGQIRRIGAVRPVVFPSNFTCRLERVQRAGDVLYVPNAETRANPLNNRQVAAQPRIGDMRVVFRAVSPHEISLVSKQTGDTFTGYTSKAGGGRKVDLLADGVEDAAAMFASARRGNAMLTWLIRLGGFLLMFFGLSAILRPISVLGDVLPILGNILEIGIGLVAGVLAAVCALVTIAVAWLFYRPLYGILLLVAAATLVVWLVRRRRAKATAPAAPVTQV